MHKWSKNKNTISFCSILLIAFLSCNCICQNPKFHDPTLTIVITKRHSKQFNFGVYDLYTNKWFTEVIEDSVYSILQSELKDSSLLDVSGAYFWVKHVTYYKTGKNDTLKVQGIYSIPVNIREPEH
jgi:hypothetical protein